MNAPAPPFTLDRAALARAFGRAAGSYDAAATLQLEVQQELLERLQFFALQPLQVLDLGAGTAAPRARWRSAFPRRTCWRWISRWICCVLRPPAPGGGREPFGRVCADAHALPLRTASVDLIFSNLMLQWSDRPERLFSEIARVLKPGGLLLCSTFGPQTLMELREAWSCADSTPHVSEFAALAPLAAAMMQAGLTEPVLDGECYRRHYADAYALMRELQRIGARNAASGRARGLLGRARLQRMLSAYEQQREAAGLPATFEVFFASAFCSAQRPVASKAVAAAEAYIPLDQLRRSDR